MIPKKIHYCWFGPNPMSWLGNQCIESWKEFLPDYEIIEWNEENIREFYTPQVEWLLRNEKWAFVSDIVRFEALYKYGGIYLDVDMEVIKSFDSLLDNNFFAGYESNDWVNAGVVGSIAESETVKNILFELKEHNYKRKIIPIPKIISDCLENEKGKSGVNVYPSDYFYPFNPYDLEQVRPQLLYRFITSNTFAIHHWQKSWKLSILDRIKLKILK